MNRTRGKVLGTALLAVTLGACDLLTVNDPGRFTSEDLNEALQAVADGVEGQTHTLLDSYVIIQALLGDEYQHTGTWGGYDNLDHGLVEKWWYDYSSYNTSRRVFGQDSMKRFDEVLGAAEAASSPMAAQVALAIGSYTLLSVWINCAAVVRPSRRAGTDDPPSPMVSDTDVRKVAAEQFATAVQVGQAAGTPFYSNAARAGRAIALYLSGDYAGAVSEAMQVPAGFSYDAIHNQQTWNSVVTLTTAGNNEAAGLMYWMWDRIDLTEDAPSFMRDRWTNEYDQRMPVWFTGEIATDNETPHHSQYKYNSRQSPIPMYHSDHMKLIDAEAKVMNDDYSGATAILNGLRAAVGLAALETPTDRDTMMEYLLEERFAELFMEGYRMTDLHRFGLVRDRFDSFNDPERPGAGRPTKFSYSFTEARFNPDVSQEDADTCFPTA